MRWHRVLLNVLKWPHLDPLPIGESTVSHSYCYWAAHPQPHHHTTSHWRRVHSWEHHHPQLKHSATSIAPIAPARLWEGNKSTPNIQTKPISPNKQKTRPGFTITRWTCKVENYLKGEVQPLPEHSLQRYTIGRKSGEKKNTVKLSKSTETSGICHEMPPTNTAPNDNLHSLQSKSII